MDMRNCRKCGKAFSYISTPICKDCEKEEEVLYNTVKDYIKDNPGSVLNEVAEATGASAKKIMRYIREGRLEITGGALASEVTCESCGKPITTGKYCSSCVVTLSQQIGGMFGKNEPDTRKPIAKMHSRKNL